MMAGDGQVTDEESFVRRGIDPTQDPPDRGRLVDAEAGFAHSANVTRIFQSLVTAIANDRVHAEIHESAGVKKGGSVAGIAQYLSQAGSLDMLVVFGLRIQRGKSRALNTKEAADGFWI